MLEEYQSQAQQIHDLLQQAFTTLEELRTHMHEEYPEEERTFRMGQAMKALEASSTSLMQTMTSIENITWPTEDRPR